MHILLFILILIIAIVVFGLSIVGFIFKTIFGLGRNSSSSSRPNQTDSRRTNQQQGHGRRDQHSSDNEKEPYAENVPEKRHKKIFTQDDGEYIDFEEIK